MSNILIVDKSGETITQLRNALEPFGHHFISADSVTQAWKALKTAPPIELVILELNLKGEGGFELIKRIRTHLIFEKLPILVHTTNTQKKTVLEVLNSGIQNYLLKPCDDDLIYSEVKKATKEKWQKRFFKDFSELEQKFDLEPLEYLSQLQQTLRNLGSCIARIEKTIATHQPQKSIIHLKKLQQTTRTIGFHLLENILIDLNLSLTEGEPALIEKGLENLSILRNYLQCHIQEQEQIIEQPIEEQVEEETAEAAETTVNREILLEKIETLDTLPTFGNFADAFKIATQEIDIDVARVVDIANKDPGLASLIISFANSAYVGSPSRIDEIEMAVQLLGYRQIQFISLSISPVNDNRRLFTAFDWKSFWINQVGTAETCKAIIEELNAPLSQNLAYLSGLFKGIGQTLINIHYPDTYKDVVDFSKQNKVPLHEAERDLLGISHSRLGSKYARSRNYPRAVEMAILNQFTPENALDFKEYAAVLSIANFLCNRYFVGHNGTLKVLSYETLNNLSGWQIIRDWLSPQISVEGFEARIEKRIRTIRAETEAYADQASLQGVY